MECLRHSSVPGPFRRCLRHLGGRDTGTEKKMSEKSKPIAGGNSLTEPPVSSNNEPFGTFFTYAADYWTDHLRHGPVDFRLDDVLELAIQISPRHRAWTRGASRLWSYSRQPRSSEVYDNLNFLVDYGNASMLEQLLDRLAQNGDGDRSFIVDAAERAMYHGNIGHFRALMNHRSTAIAMQTVEMMEKFAEDWHWLLRVDREEWKNRIKGLFDTLV